MQGLADGFADNSEIAKEALAETVDYSGVHAVMSRGYGTRAAQSYPALIRAMQEAMSQGQFKVYLGQRDVTRQLSEWGVVFNG